MIRYNVIKDSIITVVLLIFTVIYKLANYSFGSNVLKKMWEIVLRGSSLI